MKLGKLSLATGLLLGLTLSQAAIAAVSGTVYRELPVDGTNLNTYGVQDANELGVAGIDVTVTGTTGSGTAITASDGSWSVAGALGDVRVEFSNIPAYFESSPVNTGSNTAVQFIADGGTANLGLFDPTTYSSTASPMMGTSRYISGDPLLGGTSGGYQGYVGFEHSFSGEGQAGGSGDDLIPFATTAQIGSTWGATYQRSSKTLFLAASYRRHVGLGPLNTSGIYSIDLSSGSPSNVTSWLDVNTLSNVDTGSDPRSAGTDLDSEGNVRNYDWRAYPAVGKIAMGDMDISADDKTLYVVNLNEKTVIPIDIATKSLSGSVISIPDPGCSNGEYRPWGLEFHQNELYLGVVCSAETSQLQSDLIAHVMKLDSGTFSSVFSFSLNYDRGHNYHVLGALGVDAKWDPWTDDFYGVVVPDGGIPFGNGQFFPATPQPILADIEFDVDGSIILGFLDRNSYQLGYDTWPPDPTESLTDIREFSMSAGDMLRACPNGSGSWVLESNASCGTSGPTSGAGTAQGPDNGEFYYDDDFTHSDGTMPHQEVFLGGLAVLSGSGQVAVSAIDPINTIIDAGGIRWLDNSTGELAQSYLIFRDNFPPEQGKAAGLGDVEIFADPAPLEIGNRVWDDVNGNGTQDAGEAGIDGVNVTLNCGGADATETTANGGQYLFTDTNVAGGIPRDTDCTISVPTTVNSKNLTSQTSTADEPLGSNPDTSGSFTFRTGYAGQNNHTYDIGYRDTPVNDPEVDLSIVKMVSPTSASSGGTVIYTITVSNAGPDTANNVQVADQLPVGVSYVSDSPSKGDYTDGTGIWSVGALTNGETATLTIDVTVD